MIINEYIIQNLTQRYMYRTIYEKRKVCLYKNLKDPHKMSNIIYCRQKLNTVCPNFLIQGYKLQFDKPKHVISKLQIADILKYLCPKSF